MVQQQCGLTPISSVSLSKHVREDPCLIESLYPASRARMRVGEVWFVSTGLNLDVLCGKDAASNLGPKKDIEKEKQGHVESSAWS